MINDPNSDFQSLIACAIEMEFRRRDRELINTIMFGTSHPEHLTNFESLIPDLEGG